MFRKDRRFQAVAFSMTNPPIRTVAEGTNREEVVRAAQTAYDSPDVYDVRIVTVTTRRKTRR